MSMKSESNGWDRVDLSVRLTKKRKAALKELAAKLSPTATPTEAIDHGLQTALEGRTLIEEKLLDVYDALEMHSMECRLEFDRINASLNALTKNLASLHAVIAQAAQDSEF